MSDNFDSKMRGIYGWKVVELDLGVVDDSTLDLILTIEKLGG